MSPKYETVSVKPAYALVWSIKLTGTNILNFSLHLILNQIDQKWMLLIHTSVLHPDVYNFYSLLHYNWLKTNVAKNRLFVNKTVSVDMVFNLNPPVKKNPSTP